MVFNRGGTPPLGVYVNFQGARLLTRFTTQSLLILIIKMTRNLTSPRIELNNEIQQAFFN